MWAKNLPCCAETWALALVHDLSTNFGNKVQGDLQGFNSPGPDGKATVDFMTITEVDGIFCHFLDTLIHNQFSDGFWKSVGTFGPLSQGFNSGLLKGFIKRTHDNWGCFDQLDLCTFEQIQTELGTFLIDEVTELVDKFDTHGTTPKTAKVKSFLISSSGIHGKLAQSNKMTACLWMLLAWSTCLR